MNLYTKFVISIIHFDYDFSGHFLRRKFERAKRPGKKQHQKTRPRSFCTSINEKRTAKSETINDRDGNCAKADTKFRQKTTSCPTFASIWRPENGPHSSMGSSIAIDGFPRPIVANADI